MGHIVNKQILANNVKRLDIKADHIANKAKPGQFIMVVPDENSTWIPLSIVEADKRRGIITVIFKEIGSSTKKLGSMYINDEIFSIMGPLGRPATIKKEGNVICIASGTGIAQILPICKALKRADNRVTGIIGANTKKNLMLDVQMRLACHKLMITTEDGSYEKKGMMGEVLKEIINKEKVDLVYVIGPIKEVMNICDITRNIGIKTLVQFCSVLLCGHGICGSCRIKLKDELKLSCQDGVEFDGHEVDFDHLKKRQNSFVHTDEDIYKIQEAKERSNVIKDALKRMWGT